MDKHSYDDRESYNDIHDDSDELDDYDSAKQHMTELAVDEFIEQFEKVSRKTNKFKNILKKDFTYMQLIRFGLLLPFEIAIINPAVEDKDELKRYEEI